MHINLDSHHVIASCINNFIAGLKLICCDMAYNDTSFTYVNKTLKQQRTIDYALCSNLSKLINFVM